MKRFKVFYKTITMERLQSFLLDELIIETTSEIIRYVITRTRILLSPIQFGLFLFLHKYVHLLNSVHIKELAPANNPSFVGIDAIIQKLALRLLSYL